MLANIVTAAKECDTPPARIWIFNVLGQAIPSGFESWRTLLNHGETDWTRFEDTKLARETTIARLASSGTTGLPKAGNFSHHNFIAQHTVASEANPKPYIVKKLAALPMFHVATAATTHAASFGMVKRRGLCVGCLSRHFSR